MHAELKVSNWKLVCCPDLAVNFTPPYATRLGYWIERYCSYINTDMSIIKPQCFYVRVNHLRKSSTKPMKSKTRNYVATGSHQHRPSACWCSHPEVVTTSIHEYSVLVGQTKPIFELSPHFDLDCTPVKFHDCILHVCDTIALRKDRQTV